MSLNAIIQDTYESEQHEIKRLLCKEKNGCTSQTLSIMEIKFSMKSDCLYVISMLQSSPNLHRPQEVYQLD